MVCVACRGVLRMYYEYKARTLEGDLIETYLGFPYSLVIYAAALFSKVTASILYSVRRDVQQRRKEAHDGNIISTWYLPTRKKPCKSLHFS